MRYNLQSIFLASAVLLGVSSRASAQPSVEVSGGFSALTFGGCCLPTTGSVPVGWFSGVAAGLNSWLGVVGEVGGASTGSQ